MTLAVNLITRGRADYLRRTLERTLPNISRPDTVFMVSVDEDDTDTILMLKRCFSSHGLVVSIKPREDTVGRKYNRMLEAAPHASLYVNQSDYNAIVTPGFDQMLLDAASVYPDGIAVVVNPRRNASFSDLYAVTKPLVEHLGWYFPPFFPYWFVDHWIEDIAQLIGRMVMAPVAVEYDAAGKPPTQGMQEPGWWATWFDATYTLRRGQAMKVMQSDDFVESIARKTALIANMPLVEHRSRWINSNVRASEREMRAQAGQQDERYLRVREAAVAALPEILAAVAPAEAEAYRRALLPSDKIVAPPLRNALPTPQRRIADLQREYRHEHGPRDATNQVGGLLILVSYVKPVNVLEIGAHAGVSTELFALTCKDVTTVDPWADPSVLERFKSRMRPYSNVRAIQGASPGALPNDGETFDLVYIDGDHSYESVAADIAASRRLVKPGGYVAGHDYNDIPYFSGVKRAVSENFGPPDKIFPDGSWAVRVRAA